MTRDSKGQETPLDSKFDRDASTHQRKKVQNQKNFLGGHKIRPQDLLSKVAKSVRWWNYLVSITRWAIALLQRPFVRGIANILGVYHQMIRINVFWIVGNKFQTGKQIGKQFVKQLGNNLGNKLGNKCHERSTWIRKLHKALLYVEVLAEAAVVVGLADAAIVVCSSIESKSDTVSSSVSHVSTRGRICRCECRCMSQLQLD